MAKKQPSSSSNPQQQIDQFDLKHYQATEQCVARVDILYRQAIADLCALAVRVGAIPEGKQFSFAKNKKVAQDVEQVMQTLSSRITAIIDRGDREQWNAACKKSDAFIASVVNTSKLAKAQLQQYQDRNLEGLAAFQDRKVNGMDLSARVWNVVAPFQDEIELAIDTALGEGTSAAELSRTVRPLLNEPNKLFRRVRDKQGNLKLSKAAQAYHPGQGVYRSSYKNAMRLTRSEVNMAYRQSDYLRWQQLDFVVGIRIQLSNNHTVLNPNGKGTMHLYDICDELAGDYPKDFKFTGWHPQCRCFATPILRPYEEMMDEREHLDEANYKKMPASNRVSDVPDNFKTYVRDNAQRIQGWKNTPYYIKDNPQFYDKAVNPGKYMKTALVLDEDTNKRLADFSLYGFNHSGSKKFNAALEDAKKAQLAGDQAAFEKAMNEMKNQIHNFTYNSKEIPDNPIEFVQIEKEDIIKKLKELNVNYEREESYVIMKNGSVFHKVGNEQGVNFRSVNKELLIGSVVYHNHPRDTFSPMDIIFALKQRLKSIEAIDPNFEYIATPTKKSLKYINISDEELGNKYKEICDKICEEVMTKMNSREADYTRAHFPEIAIEKFCKYLGIKYTKVAI